MKTMKTPTLPDFKRFCKEHSDLAYAVVQAQAMAQVMRERVDAYLAPVLAAAALRDDKGAIITNQLHVYTCDDEAAVTAYYAACDVAHRANGYNLPDGYCPAGTAESLQVKAEWALIEAGAELFGISSEIYGQHRKDMLRLLIGACSESFPQSLRTA